MVTDKQRDEFERIWDKAMDERMSPWDAAMLLVERMRRQLDGTLTPSERPSCWCGVKVTRYFHKKHGWCCAACLKNG
jgi:hypothetical protein